MTQSNLYMDNDDLRLYIDVQPLFIDELENSKNAAASSAESAAQSAETAQTWLNNIISYKTNLELYYAQSMNSLSDWYSNTIAELNNIKNTLLQNLRTYVNDSVTSLNGLYLQMATTIQNYVNQAKDYAEQAQVTVDNRVSKSYLIDSNAFESGAIGNNILVLADIKKYAHSTYCGDQAEGSTPGYLSDGVTPLDPKKFIKVGSPTITNDGIASGFSGSNYLIANISIDTTKPWEVSNVVNCNDISENSFGNGIFDLQNIVDDSSSQICAFMSIRNSKIYLYLRGPEASIVSGTYVVNSGLSNNTDTKISLGWTGTKYYIKINNTEKWHLDESTPLYTPNQIQIGTRLENRYAYFRGTMNLKQFIVTSMNEIIFRGNKTGIDTIKPDDYTVVGTPTISADGIASGFSISNYLTKTLSIPTNSKIEVICKTDNVVSSTSTDRRDLFALKSGSTCLINVAYSYTGMSMSIVYANSATTRNTINISENLTGSKFIKCEYFNGSLKVYKGTTLNNLTQIGSTITDVYDLAIDSLCIGIAYNFTVFPFIGSIDLNAFKIYVDGDLVYQPLLRIPYTESKTGSKIVNSIYRDRVSDMAEQFGYANYYTLDENNGNFTLPMGELYGMIENLRKLIIQSSSSV